MDSESETELEIFLADDDNNNNNNKKKKKRGFQLVVLRLILAILIPIFGFFFFSLLIAFLAIFAPQFSIPTPPISLPSRCRIVSSSVDLRSSKVCELGLLNYKAKYVVYPFERSKFRCRYDYYWASVFEVEYKDHSWGQKRFALAEAPNEALPFNCRPNFGAVWLTKEKFKVNETYDCWYMSGISKMSLYHEGFFGCRAKDPSPVEMLKRYFFLYTQILQSWFIQKKGKAIRWRWDAIAGVVSGFFTSIFTIIFIRVLQYMRTWSVQAYIARMVAWVINSVFLRRAFFLVAYFSVVGWLTIQYGKRLGLPEIYRVYN